MGDYSGILYIFGAVSSFMQLYVDTNIFLDFLLDRSNKLGNNIGNPASKFFFRAISCEFHIIFSDFTAQELLKQIRPEETTAMFVFLKKKTILVRHTLKEEEEARQLKPGHWQDALHAIIAKNAKADFIVTRNKADFADLKSLVEAKFPEDV